MISKLKVLPSILFILSISSCAPKYIDHTAFEVYVRLFKNEALARHIIIFEPLLPNFIGFGETRPNEIAYCSISKTKRKIVVNYNTWESMTDDCREQVMMHELGHCVLNRPHSDDPASIMYYKIKLTNCTNYVYNRTTMLDVLFNYTPR